jgi:hypothetical protein
VRFEQTVEEEVVRPGMRMQRGVRAHWYTMSKQSGNECEALVGGERNDQDG